MRDTELWNLNMMANIVVLHCENGILICFGPNICFSEMQFLEERGHIRSGGIHCPLKKFAGIT